MNRARPCGICGHWDHPEVECFFAEPEPQAEVEIARPAYVPTHEYLVWLETLGLPRVDADHPLKRKAA